MVTATRLDARPESVQMTTLAGRDHCLCVRPRVGSDYELYAFICTHTATTNRCPLPIHHLSSICVIVAENYGVDRKFQLNLSANPLVTVCVCVGTAAQPADQINECDPCNWPM